MSNTELPKGWEWKKLGEVCELIMGQSPESEFYNEKGEGMPLINGPVEFSKGPFGLTIKSKFTSKVTKTCRQGDLLICVRGATTGRTNIAGFDACIGRGVAAIKAKQEQWYINYYINSIQIQILDKGKGSTFPAISFEELKNLQIPLPPLPTQRRIVAKIDAAFTRLDEAIQLQKQNLTRTAELKKSVLEEVFEKGEWEVKKLENVVENHDGKRKPVKSTDRENLQGIYPYYGASGIIDYVNEYLFDGEYLLLSEDGANLVVRKTPIAFIAKGKFWVNNHAHVVKAKSKVATNYFLEYFLAYVDISDFITGSAQPKLSQMKMNEIEVPVPPLTEQQKIVARLDRAFAQIDALHAEQTTRLQHLESLKSSILAEAFQGRL